MNWCWLIGHSFTNFLFENVVGEKVYGCSRCPKRLVYIPERKYRV